MRATVYLAVVLLFALVLFVLNLNGFAAAGFFITQAGFTNADGKKEK